MAKKRNTAFNTGKESESRYIVYTDGGCAFNPGGPGGYGVVIVDKKTGEINELSGGYYASTNNRMELTALITALAAIPERESAIIYSDSQYALGILTGNFSPSKNFDLVSRLQAAKKNKRIYTRWVRGHAGVKLNERCDALATEAMSAPSMKDEGFEGGPSAAAKGGAMAVQIEMPDETIRFFPEPEKHKVKEDCAAAIRRINKSENQSFKDFLQLKTGGIDGWSRADTEKEFDKRVREFVSSFFPQEAHARSCLKWYGRGLALDLAVRKELVSQEVEANAMGSR